MFNTQNNELMNSTTAYVAAENKTMENSMSLNIKISCVVGIYVFRFEKYWKKVFDLMGLNINPAFK